MTELNISSLIKSIVELWKYVSSPIWLLFFIIFISAFINKISLVSLANEIIRQAKQLISIVTKEGTSEKTNWFYTIVLIFIFLSTLHLVEASSSFIGSVLPPTLSYRVDVLFSWCNSQDRIRVIATKYPNLSSINDLSVVLEQQFNELSEKNDSKLYNIKQWGDESEIYLSRLSKIKLLLLVAVLSFIVGKVRLALIHLY